MPIRDDEARKAYFRDYMRQRRAKASRMAFKLNPKEIDSLPDGTHSDGNNLYLIVNGGSRSYALRYFWQGKSQKMGLGSARDVVLTEARDKAIDANRLLAKGINPREARDEERRAANPIPAVRFLDFAEQYRQRIEKGFKNAKHIWRWKYNVQTRFKPLHTKPIDAITTDDVVDLLEPIWIKYPVAAQEARLQLETILAAAKAAGHYQGDNPAAWRDKLKHLMPKTKRKGRVRGPMKALAFEELPAFMAELKAINTIAARMLEVCILTCARTVEIRHMKWDQIDFDSALWRVPRELMKMDYHHTVPLSKPVVAFLRSAYELRFGDYIFPGRTRGEPMSDMAMLKLLKEDMQRDATVHGFRAAFKTWADEVTNFQNQAVEFCLAHIPGDEAEKAYRRRSMLTKRKQIMDAWAAFCLKPPANVIDINAGNRVA
jgi:integrase